MNNEPFQTPDKECAFEEAAAEAEKSPLPSPAKRLVSSVFDVLEMFAWSVFAVMILFTFCVRLCRVEGQSMENTLQNGEHLLLYSLGYTPQQDDIIVFHLTGEDKLEKTLVKRVIATEGQSLVIDFAACTVTVDGKLYADSHAVLKSIRNDQLIDKYTLRADSSPYYNAATQTLTIEEIPDGMLFVMGDNRNNSKDSRDPSVGLVDERCVLGKVILRLSPFTVLS